jgi:hypothetical protein
VVSAGVDTSGVTQSEIGDMAEAFKRAKLFNVQSVLDDEEIAGQTAAHYQVSLDNEGVKDFLDDLVGKSISGKTITQADVDSLKQSIDSSPTSDGEYIDIWIYKDSKLLAKVQISGREAGQSGLLSLVFSNYGEPVEITAPDGAKSVLELTSIVQSLFTTGGLDETMPINGSFDSFLPATLGEVNYR